MSTFYVKTKYTVISTQIINGWLKLEAEDDTTTIDLIDMAEEMAKENFSSAFLNDSIRKEHQILFKAPELSEIVDEATFQALNELESVDEEVKSYKLTKEQAKSIFDISDLENPEIDLEDEL